MKNEELFREEVSEEGAGYGGFILVILGIVVAVAAYVIYHKSHSAVGALSTLVFGVGALVLIALVVGFRFTNRRSGASAG